MENSENNNKEKSGGIDATVGGDLNAGQNIVGRDLISNVTNFFGLDRQIATGLIWLVAISIVGLLIILLVLLLKPNDLASNKTTISTDTIQTPAMALAEKNLGLEEGCINSTLWATTNDPLQAPKDKCLQLQGYGFSGQSNGLFIEKGASVDEIRQGIFAAIEGNVMIRFNFVIYELFTPFDNNLANVSFGVIPTNPVDVDADGNLYYQKESPAETFPIYVKKKERGGFDEYLSKDGEYIRYSMGTPQKVTLLVQNSQLSILVNDETVRGPIFLPYSQIAFWIGYRLPINEKLKAYISDFTLSPSN